MDLRCKIALALFLITSSGPLISSVRAAPTALNFSILVFEDTGIAGDRSDDAKRSFSGLWSDSQSTSECGVYDYDHGTALYWDNVYDTIPQDNWQVIEFWFKLDDDRSINDIAEFRYWQDAEG